MFEFTQFGDLLIFFAFFAVFLLIAYFKSLLWLLRAAFAFLFAHPTASLISDMAFFKTLNLKQGFLILFLSLFVVFIVTLRKMHFNFSYHSFWAKLILALSLTLMLVYFFVDSFNPSLIVYDAFSSYKSFILSPIYALLMYVSLLFALILL